MYNKMLYQTLYQIKNQPSNHQKEIIALLFLFSKDKNNQIHSQILMTQNQNHFQKNSNFKKKIITQLEITGIHKKKSHQV